MRPSGPYLLSLTLLTVAIGLSGVPFSAQTVTPYTLISPEGRRPIAVKTIGGHEVMALDELASLFQLVVREDALAGGMTITFKGKVIVLTADQSVASVDGRLISLASPPVREGRRWLVPVDFLIRGIGAIYDRPIDVRKAARLIIVGEVRAPRVTARHEWLGSSARVTVDVSPRVPHAIVQEGDQLLIKLESDLMETTLPATVASQGVVAGIRVADPKGIVAIDLGPRFGTFRTSVAVAEPDNALRLIIELLPSGVATSPTPTEPASPLPDMLPPIASRSRDVDVIAIDPGHGGSEHGVIGSGGRREKDVALSVAYRLKGAIESRLGIRVVLTRDGDEAVGLDERAALANHNKADLFISLHANASTRPEVKGMTVLFLDAAGHNDEPQTPMGGSRVLTSISGLPREIEVIRWETAQLQYVERSASFAAILAQKLQERFQMSGPPIQRAPLRVLLGANMPAVLIEMGFMSNPKEEQALASEEYQTRVTQALFEAVAQFRQQLEGRPLAPIGPAPDIR